MPGTIFMLTAPSKTGKDRFFSICKNLNKDVNFNGKINKFIILSSLTRNKLDLGARSKLFRYSFADFLKNEVNIENNITPDMDKDKLISGKNYSPRDLYIERAKEVRYIDPNFYARKVEEEIRYLTDINVMITDLRYKNEYNYFIDRGYEVVTIRLFDQNNLVNREIDSENSLNDFITDYLIIPNRGHYKKFIEDYGEFHDVYKL